MKFEIFFYFFSPSPYYPSSINLSKYPLFVYGYECFTDFLYEMV